MREITREEFEAHMDKYLNGYVPEDFFQPQGMIGDFFRAHPKDACDLALPAVGLIHREGLVWGLICMFATGFQIGREFEMTREDTSELDKLFKLDMPKEQLRLPARLEGEKE